MAKATRTPTPGTPVPAPESVVPAPPPIEERLSKLGGDERLTKLEVEVAELREEFYRLKERLEAHLKACPTATSPGDLVGTGRP
jgi:hypothetical protein